VDIFFKRKIQTDIPNPHPWSTLFRNWGPVVVWAGLIFFFSTDQFSSSNTSRFFGPLLSAIFSGITAEQFDTLHLIIRKLAHWSEYFIFSLLLLRALRGRFKSPSDLRRAVWIVAVIFLYASSDEIHQVFVPSRTPSFADVTIDSFAGICGILWTYVRPRGKGVATNTTPGDCVRPHECKKT
jgi:VanZ family protein